LQNGPLDLRLQIAHSQRLGNGKFCAHSTKLELLCGGAAHSVRESLSDSVFGEQALKHNQLVKYDKKLHGLEALNLANLLSYFA